MLNQKLGSRLRAATPLLVCALALLPSAAKADDLVASFEEAAARGDVLEQAPDTTEYFSKTLVPYFGKKYATILKSCFTTVANPDNGSIDFVVAIARDGKTLRIYREHETNILTCISNSIAKDTFPAPPVVPYYLHIAMKFSDDPAPNNNSARKAPPLVLEPNKYSYTFGVPAGWDFSFEQAAQAGVRLLYFPTGGSFDTSSTIIYVNEADEVCATTCTGMLAKAVAKTLQESREDSPLLQVADAKPIPLDGGGTAVVQILKGWRDPRQAQEALAFIEHKETIVLIFLTTKSVKTWAADYVAFQEIVSRHKFFDCNSPGLAQACH